MTMSTSSIFPITAITSIFTMTLQRKHLLMALLALEMMILMISLMIPLIMTKSSPTDVMLILMIISFGACEACLGLACLVSLMRLKGNDMIKSTSSNKC